MEESLKFDIVGKLGHGQFSTVYKAKWLNAPTSLELLQAPNDHLQQQPLQANQHSQSTFHNGQQNISHDLIDLNRQTMQAGQPSQQTSTGHVYDNTKQTGENRHDKTAVERLVALKRINFYEFQNSKARMDYLKEINLLQQVKHPNIINFYTSYIDHDVLYIVLELADGGDLSKLIRYFQKKKRFIPEQTILKYFVQVCSAVEYIHSKRILHRDIKPANIFMTSDGCVKLGDFGLGRFFSQNTRDAHSIVGTFYYMSPERILESGYSFSSDVWSLGCVLYELITFNPPFSILTYQQYYNNNNNINHEDARKRPLTLNQQYQQGNHHHQQQQHQQRQPENTYNLQWLIDKIVKAEYPSLDSYSHISPELRQLSYDCLTPNADARPQMRYICNLVANICHSQHVECPTLVQA